MAAAIRPMTQRDVAPAAEALLRGQWGDRRAFFDFAVRHPECEPMVAEVGRTIAGTVVATRHGFTGWIGLAFVSEDQRRAGLGSALTTSVPTAAATSRSNNRTGSLEAVSFPARKLRSNLRMRASILRAAMRRDSLRANRSASLSSLALSKELIDARRSSESHSTKRMSPKRAGSASAKSSSPTNCISSSTSGSSSGSSLIVLLPG